jgi:hypothetical protein
MPIPAMTPAATRAPRRLRIKTSKTPTQIFPSDATFMVAGHHNFMDNTKRIPFVRNAKENAERLRNTDKNRSVPVSEFDNAYRNEITANEIGKRCLSRETCLHRELTVEQQR